MLDEKQVKNNIQKLIDDFKANYQEYKKESEASVETKLIEPLFKLLGWTDKDFRKRERAKREGRTGHADYAFFIGDRIAFFLEVKKVGISLEKEADKQVISYALSKRVSFAVSTNFEELKIFCVEQEDALRNKFRVFNSPDEYLSNFNDLLFLSKESFEHGIILKKAESEGRLKRRASIDKALLEDLMHIRSLIASDLEKNYHGKYEINEKDEIIQRIIDRLIFIRRCEDIGINPENLTLQGIQDSTESKAYNELKKIFSKYNDIYNSGLFAIAKDNDCDKITINGEIIKKLTQYLYESRDGKYIYNFDWIDADILGQVYEQYLGKLLAQTKSGKAKLTNGQVHRKEQGIYYTPTYIVDYIVKNTLGELLKNKKIKAKEIKVLDPACGSGSFLIKAFDYLYNNMSSSKDSKQYHIDHQGKYSIKTEILKNNIYGVDLDNKAVEITKLNLLLKGAEKNRKLPEEIDVHIRNGNSLIDEQAIAGNKTFKWEEQFSDIVQYDNSHNLKDEYGFDVIIGNPPYVNVYHMDKIERDFFNESDKFKTTHLKYDLYILFIEKSLSLLENNGLLGLIIPYSVLNQPYAILTRNYILNTCCILSIIDLSNYYVFQDSSVKTCILILKKEKRKNKRDTNKIKIIKQKEYIGRIAEDSKNTTYIEQNFFNKTPQNMFRLELNTNILSISEKLKNRSVPLGSICYISKGIVAYSESDNRQKDDFLHDRKVNSKCFPYLEGKDVERYVINYKGIYLEYEPLIMSRPTFPELHENKKILVRAMTNGLISTFDDEGYYTDQKLILCSKRTLIENYIKPSKKPKEPIARNADRYDERYIVGILNSKLMWYYYKSLFFGGLSILPEDIRYLPIKEIDFAKTDELKIQNELISHVDKMLSFNKRLNEIGDKKTSETAKMEQEIKKSDNEIDALIYKLYGLTKEEIAIVEESLKA